MKRKSFLFLTLFTFYSFFANARELSDTVVIDNPNRMSIGFFAGANYSMPSGEFHSPYDADLSSRIGYHAGAIFNYRFGRHSRFDKGGTGWFALQAEVAFIDLFAEAKNREANVAHHRYISFAGLAQFYPVKNLYIEVGAEYALSLGYSNNLGSFITKEYNSGYNVEHRSNYEYGPKFGTTVNPIVGLGLRLNNGLGFNARYVMGLLKIIEWKTNVKQMSSVQLSISYLFRIK
ncbi:MAG: outer membrane beta-barrel protein [Muribaculaceae bacterium]